MTVANVLAGDGDSAEHGGSKLESELCEDSDAVVSVLPREQKYIGRLLSATDGSPSTLYRLIQLSAAVHAVMATVVAAERKASKAGMDQLNDLLVVTGILLGLSFGCLLLPLESTRVALRPGGALEALGAGTQRISDKDARTQMRWRTAGAMVSCAIIPAGIVYCVAALMGVGPFCTRVCDLERGTDALLARVYLASQGVFMATTIPLIGSGWWPSMLTASCLCRDSITEVIKKVRATDLAEEPFESISKPALALRKSMDTLSTGWSLGLLGMVLTSLISSLAQFSYAINREFTSSYDVVEGREPGTTRRMMFIPCVLWAFFSLGLANDLANTSSRCDLVMVELNQMGIKHGPEYHSKIDWLVCMLRRLNSGQGLGFTLGYTVIDRKTINHTAVKLASTFATIYAVLLTMGESNDSLGHSNEKTEACALSEEHVAVIQAMLSVNTSCSYNMTIESVLSEL